MRRFLPAVAFAVLVAGWSAPASANCDAASRFATGVGQQVTDAVADTSLSREQRLDRFRQIFQSNADSQAMGMVALGRYSSKLPPSRASEYFNLVERMVVSTMFGQLNDYAGEQYSIETSSCSPRGERTDQFWVDGPVIKTGGGKVTDVRWLIVDRGGALKVVDVYIAGLSLVLQKRNEFDYIITDNGRRVEVLIDQLRAKYGS